MNIADFARRVDEILAIGEAAYKDRGSSPYMPQAWVPERTFSEFRGAALSLLKNVFGSQHPYYVDFERRVMRAEPDYTLAGIGILKAAKAEIVGGWAVSVKSLVSAEIFADFLEMAAYLLESHYKDAAAVMTGSVLEEHLRQLCQKHAISTEIATGTKLVPKKADSMNAELAGAGVYGKLDQKNVTAWLDLRNKAAHGNYNLYTEEQVTLMHRGVSDFMARVAL